MPRSAPALFAAAFRREDACHARYDADAYCYTCQRASAHADAMLRLIRHAPMPIILRRDTYAIYYAPAYAAATMPAAAAFTVACHLQAHTLMSLLRCSDAPRALLLRDAARYARQRHADDAMPPPCLPRRHACF